MNEQGEVGVCWGAGGWERESAGEREGQRGTEGERECVREREFVSAFVSVCLLVSE